MEHASLIRLEILDTASGPSITVKRNCSMTPRALARLLAFTAAFSFGIGIALTSVGAWPVLPFVGLEIAALAAAFYVNSRHANDYERLALAAGALEVEIREGEQVDRHRFNPHWVQLTRDETRCDLRLALRSHGKALEIGRHLDAPGRERLADTLRTWLRHAARTA